MDESWLTESEPEDEETDPIFAGLGYRAWYFRINDILVSPYNCPDCLRYNEFDCNLCEFFTPETCQLLWNPAYRTEVRTLLDIYREQQAARYAVQLRRRRALLRAARSELRAHGRPLHYSVLARMVADRYPKLKISEQGVLRIMASHPYTFEKIVEGVYQYRHKS